MLREQISPASNPLPAIELSEDQVQNRTREIEKVTNPARMGRIRHIQGRMGSGLGRIGHERAPSAGAGLHAREARQGLRWPPPATAVDRRRRRPVRPRLTFSVP